ncbi:acyl-CoA thioesterase [Cognatazoarcus halotolerans]|uniref:acyl-CoA thioesterase n=1 Tax=Cognatazoarcus halotolerans TaxID=2686016 RepID=UPI001357AC0C|nr:thioesterase family protein [Cognatazoarcus halotolerans]MBX3680648.1 acyl-CoA thioesterase [Rhodocyclaceae bacterium]MCB1900646.1 acyl-CoA thioesterase [Rhodocyclaceae bacterium]MCP5309168.1 acyl-CoA thioesterase [Zoogloeaceae bacterium]
MIFNTDKQIRFAHCDPAGIGFYPRYVELINEVVEDWFDEGLDIGFRAFHETHRLGIPTVRLEVEYIAPSRYGDRLRFELEVERIGTSSMTLLVSAGTSEEARLRAKLIVVLTSLENLRPVPIEGIWHQRFSTYLSTT